MKEIPKNPYPPPIFPAFFRVDRIEKITLTKEHYDNDLYDKYNTGNMRNYLQFMYAGKLLIIKVKCRTDLVDVFMDRLPNHWLIEDQGQYQILGAKVFGSGFIKWALSMGKSIEILEPVELRAQIIKEVKCLSDLYKI